MTATVHLSAAAAAALGLAAPAGPPALAPAQVAQMTGWELLKLVGIMRNNSWRDGDGADFRTGGHTWHVYTSTGRGRHRGTYVHLWREVQRRIVLPDGTDTGSRVADVIHVRGKASERIGQMRAVE